MILNDALGICCWNCYIELKFMIDLWFSILNFTTLFIKRRLYLICNTYNRIWIVRKVFTVEKLLEVYVLCIRLRSSYLFHNIYAINRIDASPFLKDSSLHHHFNRFASFFKSFVNCKISSRFRAYVKVYIIQIQPWRLSSSMNGSWILN